VDGAALDGFVLGGDSAFELGGVVYGKPHHPQVALERWRQMRGRVGLLHSGHWLIDHRGGSLRASAGEVSSAHVQFADVTDAEIDAYIATGEPLQVAGAFTVDGLGGAFITGIDGDFHGVVGVSLPLLRELVGSLGVAWPSLWKPA
jgi:septum formation protein